jgi:transcription antitermination factor NusG
MNWYALHVDTSLVAGAAEYCAEPPPQKTKGGLLAEALQQAGCAVRVPTLDQRGKIVPLLPGYVLVCPDFDEEDPLKEILRRIKVVPGVIRVLAEPIAVEAIDMMVALAKIARSEAFDLKTFCVGDVVEMQRGTLKGFSGVLVRTTDKGAGRWCLTFEAGGKRLAVDVGAEDARRIRQAAATKKKKKKAVAV